MCSTARLVGGSSAPARLENAMGEGLCPPSWELSGQLLRTVPATKSLLQDTLDAKGSHSSKSLHKPGVMSLGAGNPVPALTWGAHRVHPHSSWESSGGCTRASCCLHSPASSPLTPLGTLLSCSTHLQVFPSLLQALSSPLRVPPFPLQMFPCPSGLFPSTCIAEDPGGDVGTRAHDVLHVQAGLQPGFAMALVPHHPVHLRAVGKATAKELHELSQVSLVEVLLEKLWDIERQVVFSC